MIIADPILKHSPPLWASCNEALGDFIPPLHMGFAAAATPGDINRFAIRYRVAHSFGGVTLDTFVQGTVDGYTELFRIFLTYTAFEQYLRCCGVKLRDTQPMIAPYDPDLCAATIRAIPQHEQFLQAVRGHLDGKENQIHFDAFAHGAPCNVLYLASGIRHIFAHGKLTPNAGAGNVQPSFEVCRALTGFLFNAMDGDFVARLHANGIA